MVQKMVNKDATLQMYFPDEFLKGKKFDREYTFNVLNTVHPGYLEDIVAFANKQRNEKTSANEQNKVILITDGWLKEL